MEANNYYFLSSSLFWDPQYKDFIKIGNDKIACQN